MPEADTHPTADRCGGCQQPLAPGARFCSHCGRSVAGDIAPAAPAAPAPTPAGPDFERRWRNVRLVASLFGLMLAVSFATGLVERARPSPWVDVAGSCADALLALGFAIATRALVGPLLRLPNGDGRSTRRLLLVALGFVLLLTGYFSLLRHIGLPTLRITDEYRQAGWPIAAMFLLVSAMPGIFEEIAFRGVIQSVLEQTVEAREAWLIQAALFSVLHLSPLVFPSHFVMGLVFGYLRTRSRSLYPGMLLHAGWNALQLLAEI